MAKLPIVSLNPIPDEVLASNRANSHGLGLPEVGDIKPVAPRLAVLGGDPSMGDYVEELRAWDGEVWAINGAYHWAEEQGIEATFYSIDPLPSIIAFSKGAGRAVLADIVCPEVFDQLRDAHVELARLGDGNIINHTSSASTAPMIAVERGHTSLTFFGCASSFVEGGDTHLYKNMPRSQVWVQCGGQEYLTTPQYIAQAEFMAELARGLPNAIMVRGRGFLPALIEHGDYDVTHIDRGLHDALYGVSQQQVAQ